MARLNRVRRLPPDPTDLALLPGWDFADCYAAPTRAGLGARQAAQAMFEDQPAWIGALMRLRNTLARPLGLKTTAAAADSVGVFPVISETPERLVMGFDDRHLDFVLVIEVRQAGQGSLVRVSTLVRLNGLLGRAYLAAIMPFHVLIVRTLVGRAGAIPPPEGEVARRAGGG